MERFEPKFKLPVHCCDTMRKLRKEYENALKFEALAYARVLAHRERHADVEARPAVYHMRLVNEIAERYAEGDVEALGEIPPAD